MAPSSDDLHTCHAECPCQTGGEPLADFEGGPLLRARFDELTEEHLDLKAEVARLRDWLYYIEQTTGDDNVLAAVELANKGLAAEFEEDVNG